MLKRKASSMLRVGLADVVALLGALCALALAPAPVRAEPPPAELVQQLRQYDFKSGDAIALMKAVVPKLARFYLNIDPKRPDQFERGGPLPDALNAALLSKLDDKPGSLPIIVYKKEDGRLPGAFILARYRGVTPAQMVFRMSNRAVILKHPLVDQYEELTRLSTRSGDGPYGPGALQQTQSAMYVVSMPFGAGLFGLRPSFVMGEWDSVLLPNGVAISSFLNRPAKPEELAQKKTFKDKKDRSRELDSDYYQGNEYRLTSLLLPEKGDDGKTNTLQIYFVRIVPALKPGTTLVGSGAFANWLFTRGAAEALVTPVKLIRDELERLRSKH